MSSMSSKTSRHFNGDDYDSAAQYGKLYQQSMYTTKGPTYERKNKNNRDHKPLMPELPNLRMRQYFHPQRDRIDWIQRRDSNLKTSTARYQKPNKQIMQE